LRLCPRGTLPLAQCKRPQNRENILSPAFWPNFGGNLNELQNCDFILNLTVCRLACDLKKYQKFASGKFV